MTAPRYEASSVTSYATALLEKAGLENTRAHAVAEVLVEGDLMGHTTHGMQLLGPYLKELESGGMAREGELKVVSDRGAAICWDGQVEGGRLPGPWLVREAIALGQERAITYGTATVVIRNAHHIASLAAYLREPTLRGMMVEVVCSDPASASVAPFGGLDAVMTPNPVAVGIPTENDPIIIDVSMSVTTNGMTMRLHKEGERFAHPWLKDNKGNATDDPAAFFTDPPGTVLPIGGMDHGHKGYGLGLWVEAMTSAMGGYGRADQPTGWGAAVLVRVTDPSAFGGLDEFKRQTEWLAQSCRDNSVPEGAASVRLPGERGLNLRREQLENGVVFHSGIIESLLPWAEKFDVTQQPVVIG